MNTLKLIFTFIGKNFLITFYVITFILLFVKNSDSQWKQQQTPVNSGVVLGINFTDPLKGCIGGWSLDPEITGKIFYTTNGGEIWLPSILPDSVRAITDIKFVSSDLGYATGAYNQQKSGNFSTPLSNNFNLSNYKKMISGIRGIPDYDDIVLKTTDAGITWHTLGYSNETFNYIYQIIPIDKDTALISGTYQTGINFYPGISRTTDGGLTWNDIYVPPGFGDFNEICYNYNFLFAAGYQKDTTGIKGIILKSTDLGSSWNKTVFNEVNNFTGIRFINKNTGYASAVDQISGYSMRSAIYKTTNSGTNWYRQHVNFDSTFISGLCIRDNSPDIMFYGNRVEYYGINLFNLKQGLTGTSQNYGNSWMLNTICDTGILLNSQYLDTLNMFLTGAKYKNNGNGTEIDGLVFHSSKGGFTGIVSESSFSPEEFILYQNYPNPFNPFTIINYKLEGYSKIKLSVFDINGKEITTLINEEKPAGRYSVQFDGSDLSSGVYFYRLETNNYRATRKMLIVK